MIYSGEIVQVSQGGAAVNPASMWNHRLRKQKQNDREAFCFSCGPPTPGEFDFPAGLGLKPESSADNKSEDIQILFGKSNIGIP